MPRKKKPFFYYDKLKLWEIITMGIYAAATIAFVLIILLANPNIKLFTLVMYTVVLQLSFYLWLYTSLRNFRSYLIWFGFGILHLLFFLIFKAIRPGISHENSLIILLNTIPLLLLFQLLRYLSLEIQHREFVVPSKGGGRDLFENKIVSATDYAILIIYFTTISGLIIMQLPH